MKTEWLFSAHPVGLACLAAGAFLIPIERLGAALIAIILHEAAHLLCIRLCRVKRCAVEWTPFGFVAKADGFSHLPASKQALIAVAGIAASAIGAVVCYPFVTYSSFVFLLYQANLALLFINTLPVFPLDGGRVLLALAGATGMEVCVRKILIFLSYSCAVFLGGLGIYSAFCGILNPTLLILGPYLAYAIRQGSIQYGMETAQMLEKRLHRQGDVYRTDSWVSIGEPNSLKMMRIFRQSSQKKFVLLHTIDPVTGEVSECITEQKMIVKLYDNPEIGG